MANYSAADVPDQTGRVIVITGANTGIGFEAARVLASRGGRVLLGCRSEPKANEAMDRIRALHPAAQVEWLALDLASLASVRSAAEQLQQEPFLDLLINNAGVMVPPRSLTEDGFELQFGVNHLGHFALTGLLLDKLARRPGARIVNVSSLAHVGGRIDFDDINAEKGYLRQSRYQMSKLANMLFTLELQRRLAASGAACLAVACHPGIADTELARYMSPWIMVLVPLLRPFFNTPAEGALPTLQAATDQGVRGGDYYGPTQRGETARSSGKARIAIGGRDAKAAARLWVLSETLTGVTMAPGA